MSRAQLIFRLCIVIWGKLLGLLLCPRASNFPLRAHRASSLYSHWVYSRVMAMALHAQTTLVHTSAEYIEAFVPKPHCACIFIKRMNSLQSPTGYRC